MFTYLLKRILLFVPTLLLVSMLSFGLSRLSPGDPVTQYFGGEDVFVKNSKPQDLLKAENRYAQAAATLHLDRPTFYFSLTSQAYPDTLYKVPIRYRRETLEKLIGQYGNWPQVQAWYADIRSFDLKLLGLTNSSLIAAATPVRLSVRELYTKHLDGAIGKYLAEMEDTILGIPTLAEALGSDFFILKNDYEALKKQATPYKHWVPAFHWYGADNQYHLWLTGFIKGDFGISLYHQMPVADKVKPALFWTLTVSIPAIFIAFLLAVPLGIWSAVKRGKTFDKATTVGLFILYSLPAFWVATLLLTFLTNPQYGMNIFPGPGLGEIPTTVPWQKKIWLAIPHLLLPIACVTFPSLAYISRQARSAMINVLGTDFIRTAYAKGLPKRDVIWKHGFSNALFPLITLFSSVLPSAIAGSVAIEVIFNIPGMGWLTINSINQKDWPIVFAVLMLGAVLTMVGMLISDILYKIADPRVKY